MIWALELVACRAGMRAVPAPVPSSASTPERTVEELTNAMLAAYADAGAERTAVIAAAGTPEECRADWCRLAADQFGATRDHLVATRSSCELAPVSCSALACWSELIADEPGAVAGASGHLRQLGWTGVSLVGGPHLAPDGRHRALVMLVKPPDVAQAKESPQ